MKVSEVKFEKGEKFSKIECEVGGGTIFIEVENKYEDYLVHEVADSFVIAAMLPSLILGEDIYCETISDDLYYHSPTILYLLSKTFNKPCIKIVPKKVIHLDFKPQAVGSGFSGGIDSFTTFINHTGDNCPEAYRLTHLTLFNVGAYGNDYGKTKQAFLRDLERAKIFASKVNMPLVAVNTNIGLLYSAKEIHHYSLRSTLCLSVAIKALSKLFRRYYISSTGTIDDMKLDKADQYFYECSLIQLLCSSCTDIFITETNLNRVEKTKIVVNSDLAKKYLYVCAADIFNEAFNMSFEKDTAPNCSQCSKCVRTMLTIDFLGYRDAFKNRFDWGKYDKDFKKNILYIATDRYHGHFSREIYELMCEKGIRIPFFIQLTGLIRNSINSLKRYASRILKS